MTIEETGAAGRKRKHWLKDLHLLELSLVDNPANEHAKVSIFKRADAEPDATAISKGVATMPTMTVTEAERALDQLVAKRRASHNESEATAMVAVLETVEGVAAYSAIDAARMVETREDLQKRVAAMQPVAKAAPMKPAEAELDKMAREFAEKRGVSVAKAYDEILRTSDVAKGLYSQIA